MSRIFISYSRDNEAIAKDLVDDLEAMGHDVWLDQELSGGQKWWDRILAQIRECDLFVLTLAPESLDSIACGREYTYAADLGKPLLPVLVAEGVSTNALPPALSEVQFVDYRNPDRTAALRLARAISSTRPATPLPDPLPEPPKVPLSYLGGLRQQLDGEAAMPFDNQSSLLIDLKRSMRDPATRDDGVKLLRVFRQRRDLLATIADEIDEILERSNQPPVRSSTPAKVYETAGSAAAPAPAPTPVVTAAPAPLPVTPSPVALAVPEPVSSAPPRATPSGKERLWAATAGAVVGTLLGMAVMSTEPYQPLWPGTLLGAGAAIAGTISGKRLRVILAAIGGGFIGAMVIVSTAGSSSKLLIVAANLGFPMGAVAGALVGAVLEKVAHRAKPAH